MTNPNTLQQLESIRASLAPRYDVEREIGVGGMARVYLAHEQHPRRRVAIKVLDPELSTRLLRERFLREVDVASKLTHPHIVPIFAAGEAGELFYYVMPYIEGESLRHRLVRERRLTLEGALHVVTDVADALEFAHSHGIVHRDIKPENILLSSDHAVVADFGIARAISAAGEPALTATGQSIGSPGYMSPEQAWGMTADARSDIYSLGCVLFETLAGDPPIVALTEHEIHNWDALVSSPALRGATHRVARAVKHTVSKALAPAPEQRFASAAEFVQGLGGSGFGRRASAPARGFNGNRGARWLVAAATLVVVLGVTTAAIVLRHPARTLSTRRVSVAPLENRTGNAALDNLGLMAADWITQGLAQTGLMEIVPSGRATGAGTLVAGGYYGHGDSIRFQVQITSGEDGRVLRVVDPVVAAREQPLTAIEPLRQRVTAALAALFDARLNFWATAASLPPTYPAYQEFIAGLDRFSRFDLRGAAELFERAARLDTTFHLSHLIAAYSYMSVGDFATAESLAHVVERHGGQLAPLDRAYLGWVLAICRGDLEAAFQSSSTLNQLVPRSEMAFMFATDAMALNRPRAALDALRELDPDHGFTRSWWAYWRDRTTASHMVGDHRAELRDAEEGVRRFPANLQMLTAQARALAALGRSADVERVLEAAANLDSQLEWSPANVMLLAASELRAHGHPAAAASTLLLTQRWLDTRARTDSSSPVLRYLRAVSAYTAGRLDEARGRFEQLARHPVRIEAYERLNAPPETIDFVGYLGVIAARQQHRTEALRRDGALAAMTRPYLYGRHTMWRARIHASLGEREAALGLVRDALRQGYPHMHSLHSDMAFEPLRDYGPFQELLKQKD